jgi:hypothetical protein
MCTKFIKTTFRVNPIDMVEPFGTERPNYLIEKSISSFSLDCNITE